MLCVLEGPNGVGWLHCLEVRDKMPHRWALPLCNTQSYDVEALFYHSIEIYKCREV